MGQHRAAVSSRVQHHQTRRARYVTTAGARSPCVGVIGANGKTILFQFDRGTTEALLDGAKTIGETIRQGLAALEVEHEGSPLGITTVSIGAASANPNREDIG
jgi:hypothetical protein